LKTVKKRRHKEAEKASMSGVTGNQKVNNGMKQKRGD